MSIIRGIFIYSAVPFLKLRANTVFILGKWSHKMKQDVIVLSKVILSHFAPGLFTSYTEQDVLLCKYISKHCFCNF